jgi:hypothetical protein
MYDQSKAYDSVQLYSIKASLERFNLPEKFINYILSIHSSIKATFKTYFGLTDSFTIENSIKQGDPIAPLIFVFITDAVFSVVRLSMTLLDRLKGAIGLWRLI